MVNTGATSQEGPLPAGFHRRIRLFPGTGRIVAGLEDNLHRFALELSHRDRIVTDIRMRTERYPWTTCASAPAFLREQMVGRPFDALAGMDIFQHCTHLFELAVLCAWHALDPAPVQFDLHVADWTGEETRVRLKGTGRTDLELHVRGWVVETPGQWFERDFLRVSQWRHDLDAASAEAAMLIGRAIYVSLGRASAEVERASDRGPRVHGVCFSYQPQMVVEAVRMPQSRREFTGSAAELLSDFDPTFPVA